jgi:hypothetical protein
MKGNLGVARGTLFEKLCRVFSYAETHARSSCTRAD